MNNSFRIIFLTLLLGSALQLTAQDVYQAGFSKVSIEPSSYPFSLALAGYGLPREGRFTIDWSRCQGDARFTKAFTGSQNHLYFIHKGELMCTKAGKEMQWRSMGHAAGIQLLAADDRVLFAVDSSGRVLRSPIGKRLHWKEAGQASNLTGLTLHGDTLYAIDYNGAIVSASVNGLHLNWQKRSELKGACSLTSFNGSLYALTQQNEIFQLRLPGAPLDWIKIAAYNGITYAVQMKAITVCGNTLYGIDDYNLLYSARQKSRGDLSVTALAIADGRQTVVLVGADLTGFNYDFTSSVKQEVYAKYSIPSSAILINASHTHFAPVTQRWTTWAGFCQKPDSFYLNAVVRPAMVSAIEQALKNMVPSNLSFGRGKTTIGGNRALSNAPVPYDDDVDVISVTRLDNLSTSVLFLTGCHPVFKNEGAEAYTISPNFPGATRAILQKDANVSEAMFLQGCAGDINPVDAKTTEHRLASDVLSVLGSPMLKLGGEISCYMDSVRFRVSKWSRQQIMDFRQQNTGREGDVEAEKNVRWADLMLDQDSKNSIPEFMPVYIQTINIGNWKLVGLSREAVTDYSISIKGLWPGQPVSVAGYCNDVSSYLPTARHIKAGTYEGHNSFFWYAQPSVFPETVQQDILNEIKKQNH